MELTPNDIRNFEFASSLRGYDKEAVDNFKEQVALTLETLKQENLKLTMEVESVKIQLAGLKQFEDAIKNAAIDARRNADQTIANAKREAELIVSKANAEADQLLSSRAQRHAELESSITKLELTKKSYMSKLRNLIASHLEWLEEFTMADARQNVDEEDLKLEVTESEEVTTGKRETVATAPSKHTTIVTEEVKAASKIVQAAPDTPERPLAESLKEVIKEEAPKAGPIDPELAQALENYRRLATAPTPDQTAKVKTQQPHQPYVQATDRSEDIPRDFVPKKGDVEFDKSTDKVKVPPPPGQPMEYNAVKLDSEETPAKKPVSTEPDDLAKVLDNVVSKFEEEMDKAARS